MIKGKIVSMCYVEGFLFIATEYYVYKYNPRDYQIVLVLEANT